jgi:hypothetical protein
MSSLFCTHRVSAELDHRDAILVSGVSMTHENHMNTYLSFT